MYNNFQQINKVVSTAPEKDNLLKIVYTLKGFMKAVLPDHISICAISDIMFSLALNNTTCKK